MVTIISAALLIIYNTSATMEMLRFYVYTRYKSRIITDIIHQILLQVHDQDKARGRSIVFRSR